MKKIMLGFILGGIVFGCVGIYAANYLASDISYTPSDESWEVTNVSEALDELYENIDDSEIIKKQYIFTSTDSNLFQTKDISIEDKEIVSYGIKSISLDLKGIGHNSSYKYVHAIGLKDFDGTNITGYCYAQSNYSGTIAYGTITVEVVYK